MAGCGSNSKTYSFSIVDTKDDPDYLRQQRHAAESGQVVSARLHAELAVAVKLGLLNGAGTEAIRALLNAERNLDKAILALE